VWGENARDLLELGIVPGPDALEKAVADIAAIGFLDGVKLLFELMDPDEQSTRVRAMTI
jgi:hypothetical protein